MAVALPWEGCSARIVREGGTTNDNIKRDNKSRAFFSWFTEQVKVPTMTNSSDEAEIIYRQTVCRGIRGATTVEENSAEAILSATRELLYIIMRANEIQQDDVASAMFTTTMDLDATYPALAARQLGWYDAALLCGNEMQVPGSVSQCIRILIHWNTRKTPDEIVHVYLRRAKDLRADRTDLPPIPYEEIEAAINFEAIDTDSNKWLSPKLK
jgi:chorismate mutase